MNSKRGGFTIVELLLSAVVLGLSVIAFSVLINSLNVLNEQAKDLTLANGLIEEKLEDLRSQGYLALNDETVDFTSELSDEFADPKSASYTVSTVKTGLKQIDFDIQYSSAGKTQSLEFSSYISELGLSQ